MTYVHDETQKTTSLLRGLVARLGRSRGADAAGLASNGSGQEPSIHQHTRTQCPFA